MKYTKSIKILIFAAILFAVIFAMSRFSAASEFYAQNVYPIIAAVLSWLSWYIPFSMHDALCVCGILFLPLIIILVLIRKLKIKKALYLIFKCVLILIAWFYFVWGFCYFRYDFYQRCNIEKKNYNEADFEIFTHKFIADANKNFVNIDTTNFVKSGMINGPFISNEIEQQYKLLSNKLSIKYPCGKCNIKLMLFRDLYTKMGVSGYFGPFFNEVHVNNFAYPHQYPYILAHEKAHQFGITSEAECNLYAFLVCALSDNKVLKSSAYTETINYVLGNYIRIFPNKKDEILNELSPELAQRLKITRNHWLMARDQKLSDMQSAANNAYLKINKINSGVKNYSEVVELLISSYDIFIK